MDENLLSASTEKLSMSDEMIIRIGSAVIAPIFGPSTTATTPEIVDSVK